MNDSRRGFFRLLGAAVAVPPLAVLAKGIAPEELPVSGVAIFRASQPQVIQRAFILLGLLAPGERISEPDYHLAFNVMDSHPEWTDHDLAKALAPHYNIAIAVAYREDGHTFYRFHFGPDLKLPEGAVGITA